MRRFRYDALLLLSLLTLTLAACHRNAGGTGKDPGQDAKAALCRAPISGQRFSVCGRLSTLGVEIPASGTYAVGSVDATTSKSASEYRVTGGSFHAGH